MNIKYYIILVCYASSLFSSSLAQANNTLWTKENLNIFSHKRKDYYFDTEFGENIAKTATHHARHRPIGLCLRYVRRAFERLNSKNHSSIKKNSSYYNRKLCCDIPKQRFRYWPERSANDFLKWAKGNPLSLFKHYSLLDVTMDNNLKIIPGMVFIFAKGTCGYHKYFGHIEIITKTFPLCACSDSCHKIKKCKPSMILAPIKTSSPFY
jgi:hypothetical protein